MFATRSVGISSTRNLEENISGWDCITIHWANQQKPNKLTRKLCDSENSVSATAGSIITLRYLPPVVANSGERVGQCADSNGLVLEGRLMLSHATDLAESCLAARGESRATL